jgi:hypothetical protein
MAFESPSLEVMETFGDEDVLYAPKVTWMTVGACILVTVGTTIVGP